LVDNHSGGDNEAREVAGSGLCRETLCLYWFGGACRPLNDNHQAQQQGEVEQAML